MKPGTIDRVQLARYPHQLPPYRVDHWILAGSHVAEPYPCTCRYDPCRYLRCPDRYRTEGDALPWGCCGRAGHTREADAGRIAAEDERRAGSGRAVARPGWAARFPTAPVAPVADTSLWDAAGEEAPPEWDAIDEVPGSHEETLEDIIPHWESMDPAQGAEEEAEKLWRAEVDKRRARVAAAVCECPTPWDTRPPALLWAAGPKAPVPERVLELSAKPGADVRAEADTAIELAGARRTKPWKQTRHALLPPEGKTKTRPCWSAPLDTGQVAVIDLPPEPRGGGVHCGDCCRSFANSGAYEMHRKRQRDGRHVCVDPACVMLVDSARLALTASPAPGVGTPLLRRSFDGVWSVDPLAVWGADGPPMSPEQANTIYWDAQRALQARPWQFGRGDNRRRS